MKIIEFKRFVRNRRIQNLNNMKRRQEIKQSIYHFQTQTEIQIVLVSPFIPTTTNQLKFSQITLSSQRALYFHLVLMSMFKMCRVISTLNSERYYTCNHTSKRIALRSRLSFGEIVEGVQCLEFKARIGSIGSSQQKSNMLSSSQMKISEITFLTSKNNACLFWILETIRRLVMQKLISMSS